VVTAKGKTALTLSEGSGMGVVWLEGYQFSNGVIEVDMLGRSQPVQGSFVGVAFRVADATTHDAVYFRPFKLSRDRSGTPPPRRAIFVAPAVALATAPSGAPRPVRTSGRAEPDGDNWFHARIVVERPKVSVFVDDRTEPSLVVNELGDRGQGSVGVWVGEGSGGSFANLRVTRQK